MNECPKCKTPTMARLAHEIFQCAACSTRVAHGELMPRIVVKPHDDRRFIVVTIFDANVENSDGSPPSKDPTQIVVDRALAKLWGISLVSIGG